MVNPQNPNFISQRHIFVVMERFTVGMENNAAMVNNLYHIKLNCYLYNVKENFEISYKSKQTIH